MRLAVQEERWRHVRAVLKSLQENGLIVRFNKCIFNTERVDFLGHQIPAADVKPISTKVDAMKTFPTPSTIRHLQEFLGMVNYYRRFIPNIGHILTPLNDVPKRKAKKLVWGHLQQRPFDRTNAALAEATTLVYYDDSAPLKLTTDSSNVACGSVIKQIINGYPQHLASSARNSKLRKLGTARSTGRSSPFTLPSATSNTSFHHRDGPPAPDPRFHANNDTWQPSQSLDALLAMNWGRRTTSPTPSPGSRSTQSTWGSTTPSSP
ncbi:uncharacterized protein [Palaemon carinicauda]|uniref:uncharacterized protein n=1 Tax=Palaemon carinicauda TaxID=392227 RepID=UPI0035B5A8B1